MAKGKYQRWLTAKGLKQIEEWAREYHYNAQLAEKMGVNRDTLNDWSKRFPVISDAIKKGRDAMVDEVEDVMLKAIKGYEYTETTVIISPDGTKKGQQVTKYAKPDTALLIFFLKNMRPNKWRDKPIATDEDKAMEKLVSLMSKLDEEAGV